MKEKKKKKKKKKDFSEYKISIFHLGIFLYY